jgi:septum formation protein
VRPADVDEDPRPGEDPAEYVLRIADTKALAVRHSPGQWVLAADTTVTIDGQILGKAATLGEAATMLRALSGRVHQVITGFAIVGEGVHHRGRVSSDVEMIELAPGVIADYLASGEWRGKAGAYAVQGIAAAFVRAVRGSVTNVIGLPLVEVLAALSAVGAPSARLAAGIPC